MRANSIALGVIDTGIFHRLREENDTFFDEAWHEAVMNARNQKVWFAKRVADTAVFLASSKEDISLGIVFQLMAATTFNNYTNSQCFQLELHSTVVS